MVTLAIMCGFPFSGKSTLANRLVAEREFFLVSVDQINDELGLGSDPELPITAGEWDRTYSLFYERISTLLRDGLSVVADTAGYSRKERNELRVIGESAGAKVFVIYVQVPLVVARDRLLLNRLTKTRHDVRDADFHNVVDHFEEPGSAESTFIFGPSTAWTTFLCHLSVFEQ